MVKAIFDHLAGRTLKNHFTIGIQDDVTHTSLPYDPEYSTESERVIRALFYGLGSDGTVGANKNSIKIIGENTDNYAQGYFVYDSKKAGAVTVSHLRFGPEPIHSTYLVDRPNFVACHQPVFLERYEMLGGLVEGGTFLLNSAYGPQEVWHHLPRAMQEQMLRKKAKFYVIDANKVARESGMGSRINTVMQVCFFALSGVLPKEAAIAAIKNSIAETYGKKGDEIVRINLAAVDRTLAHLFEVKMPERMNGYLVLSPPPTTHAAPFVREVLGKIIAGKGDDLPVSALPVDGTFPTGTAKWEKRNLALEIPVWEPDICIQCGK
jgi:pyruvate-ferredoxin/flavodoxin oxidoreductase